ncbi:MAG: hypothetical protein ABI791_11845 [Acidobacteriota bacterium]
MKAFILLTIVALMMIGGVSAQDAGKSPAKSLEVSEVDGVPVLVKHLPDAEEAQARARFIKSPEELRETLGDRPVLKVIEFNGGTEAVEAPYEAGRLLIVEYTNPQGSIDADQKVLQTIAEGGEGAPTAYRRIGNYNVFVFDGTDEAAAAELLDQVKYQKTVQWLGEDPYLLRRVEKYFVTTTRDIFISTVVVIVMGIGGAIVAGIIAGFFYFRFRDRRRERTAAFSDAGGLTRLNLDDLTSEIAVD